MWWDCTHTHTNTKVKLEENSSCVNFHVSNIWADPTKRGPYAFFVLRITFVTTHVRAMSGKNRACNIIRNYNPYRRWHSQQNRFHPSHFPFYFVLFFFSTKGWRILNLPPDTSHISNTLLPSLYASTLRAFSPLLWSYIIGRSGWTGVKENRERKKMCMH